MVKKIITKKYFILLLLLSFISSCFAMESSIDSYLKEGGKENNANFKDEKSYLAWMETANNKKKPKTVIVGSGRGIVSNTENYANNAYPKKEYDYLLINYTGVKYGKETQPDLDIDIRKISALTEMVPFVKTVFLKN